MTDLDIFKLFQLAGDVGIWAVFAALWMFDRRLIKLETRLGLHLHKEKNP